MLICFFIPLHFPPWMSWHSEMVVVAGVMLACIAVLCKSFSGKSQRAVQLPRSVSALVLLPAFAFYQWWLGQLPYGGDVLVIGFYAALCVGCIALGYGSGDGLTPCNPCELLAWVLLTAGIGSTFIAMVQTLDVWTWSEWVVRGYSLRRPGANLGQPNHLALLLTMAMASLYYINLCNTVLGKWVSLLFFALLAVGLAMTESRAGLLQLWVIAGWLCVKRPVAQAPIAQATSLGRLQILAGAVFATALFLNYPAIFGMLTGLENTVGRMSEGSLRLVVWPQLLEAVMLKPWLGWGMLQVGPAHNTVAHAYPVAEAFHYSHNIFLDLAVWLGLPAAAVLSVLTGLWLLRHIKKAQDAKTVYALALLIALGVAGVFEFQHAYAYFLAPAAIAVGVLERAHGARVWHFLNVRVALAATVATACLMAWSAVEYFSLEEDIRVARFQVSRIGSTPPGYQAPTTMLLTQLSAVANNSRIQVTPNMPLEQLTALKNTALRYPWTATQSRYAMALALNGNITEAQRQLRVMRAQHGNAVFLRVVDELNTQLQEKNSAIRFLSY